MIGRRHFSTAAPHEPDPVVSTTPATPEQLRGEAERALADAEREAIALRASAEEAADALIAEAERLEAEAAELARVHTYLVAVGEARDVLGRAVARWQVTSPSLEKLEARHTEVVNRHREAEARASKARKDLERLVAQDADLDVLQQARLDLATAESLPALVAQQLEQAEQTHQQAVQAVASDVESVRLAWCELRAPRGRRGCGTTGLPADTADTGRTVGPVLARVAAQGGDLGPGQR